MLIEGGGVKHYFLVKSLSHRLASQVPKNNGKHYFCLRCLNPFWCQESLNKHQEYCSEYEAVKIELPEKGTMLKFKNYHRSEKELSSSTLTLTLISSRCNRAIQTPKVVTVSCVVPNHG